MSASVPVALVGTGDWGSNWLRLLARLPQVDLARICDRDEGRLEKARVRAVVVASSAPTHAELASRALAAGKDVLVEKPMTLSLESARSLVQEARRGGRVLMVGHLLLYHPAVERMKAMLDAGEL